MNSRERAYLDKVAALGCIICKDYENADTPATIHHIRDGQGMSQRASNYLVVPLCSAHHQTGGPGVAYHAGPKAFEAIYATELDLLARTIELLSQRMGL